MPAETVIESHRVADAIRDVVLKLHLALKHGHRSQTMSASDVGDILLAIAEKLDPVVCDEDA